MTGVPTLNSCAYDMAEYDQLMQDEYDYEEYYETCPEDAKRLTFEEWRERSKGGWWALRYA